MSTHTLPRCSGAMFIDSDCSARGTSIVQSYASKLQLRVGVGIDLAAQIDFFELWCHPRHWFSPRPQLRSSEYKSSQSGCPKFPDREISHIQLLTLVYPVIGLPNRPRLHNTCLSSLRSQDNGNPRPTSHSVPRNASISARIGQPEQQFRNPTLRFSVTVLPVLFSSALEDRTMPWITPTFEEIDLGCEINSYANAEL